ncbi:MAG: hypothetical protein QOH59_1790 [Gemmatimonadales bacterium]|nr:hypothetical protein [Gemmatimonadales bacterium]
MKRESPILKKAASPETAELVELMAEFYAESGYQLNRRRATATFAPLLSDPRLGHAWLIQSQEKTAGYVVLVMGYSMEHGGLIAYVDDLFIRPAFRRGGLATEALDFVRSFCTSLEARAIYLEVGLDNDAAQAVYRRMGFANVERRIMALQLAEPTHAA